MEDATTTSTKRLASGTPKQPRKRRRLPAGPVDPNAYAAALAEKDKVVAKKKTYMAEHAVRLKEMNAELSNATSLVRLYEARIDEQEKHRAWLAELAKETAKAKLDEERAGVAKVRRGASHHAQLCYALQTVKRDIDGEPLDFPEDLEWAKKMLRDNGITSVLDICERIYELGGTCSMCGHQVRDEYCLCETCDAHVPNDDGFYPDPAFAHLDWEEARRAELESLLYGYRGGMSLPEAMTFSQAQIDRFARKET